MFEVETKRTEGWTYSRSPYNFFITVYTSSENLLALTDHFTYMLPSDMPENSQINSSCLLAL